MADATRHSQALEAEILTDPMEKARKESFNVVEQFRAVSDMVEAFLDPQRPFKLRPSHLLHLHRARLWTEFRHTPEIGGLRESRLGRASTSRQRRLPCRGWWKSSATM